MSANTQDSLKEVVTENFELLVDSGITKPCANITLEDKVPVVQTVALEKVILRTLGELTQFKDGLQCLDVGKEIICHSEILQEFFVKAANSKITSGSSFLFYIVHNAFNEIYASCRYSSKTI